MCIIAYKPLNVAFPEESVLKNCWDNNPDMGGFMYTWKDHVYIQKGYETFESFMKALNKVRAKAGDNIPYVMHFRISTQGFDRDCCQPFPLSGNMKNLKREKVETNIGVAHNGIISLTSDGSKDYSDTMLFITEYLVNIIRSYDWYKDPRTEKLIENLIVGSRLAILDKKGHCELMGKGWVENKGCYYSNSTYSYKKWSYTGSGSNYNRGLWDDYYDDGSYAKYWEDYWNNGPDKKEKKKIGFDMKNDEELYLDPWLKYYDAESMQYFFDENYCPCSMEDDDSYCECCAHCNKCSYVFACKKASGYND